MANRAYIGVSGTARRVKKLYTGVNGKARKVRRGYVGVNGKARLFFRSNIEIVRLPTYFGTDLSIGTGFRNVGSYGLLSNGSKGYGSGVVYAVRDSLTYSSLTESGLGIGNTVDYAFAVSTHPNYEATGTRTIYFTNASLTQGSFSGTLNRWVAPDSSASTPNYIACGDTNYTGLVYAVTNALTTAAMTAQSVGVWNQVGGAVGGNALLYGGVKSGGTAVKTCSVYNASRTKLSDLALSYATYDTDAAVDTPSNMPAPSGTFFYVFFPKRAAADKLNASLTKTLVTLPFAPTYEYCYAAQTDEACVFSNSTDGGSAKLLYIDAETDTCTWEAVSGVIGAQVKGWSQSDVVRTAKHILFGRCGVYDYDSSTITTEYPGMAVFEIR